MTRRAARIAVRQARDSDLDAVVAMRSALLEDSRNNPAYRRLRRDFTSDVRRLFAAQLADQRGITFIALHDEDPIGLLRCTLSSANPLYHPARHAHVVSVYVMPLHRRRGVLKALMRQATAWCAERGVVEMRVHCGIENRAGNAAWKALGFEPAEILRVRRLPTRRGKT